MPVFEATMRTTHVEIWTVEAKDAADARQKISDLSDSVETDETGGELVDWEVYELKEATQ